jgi:hypothetical protein
MSNKNEFIMIQYLNILEEERKLLMERTRDLTVDQYNIIPHCFNNNIIWNMGHILVAGLHSLYGVMDTILIIMTNRHKSIMLLKTLPVFLQNICHKVTERFRHCNG